MKGGFVARADGSSRVSEAAFFATSLAGSRGTQMFPFRMLVRLCRSPGNVNSMTRHRSMGRAIGDVLRCSHPLSPGYCRTRSQIAVALRIVSRPLGQGREVSTGCGRRRMSSMCSINRRRAATFWVTRFCTRCWRRSAACSRKNLLLAMCLPTKLIGRSCLAVTL
jgi:hypothetical protein